MLQCEKSSCQGYADLPEGAPLEVPRLAKPFSDAALTAIIAAVAG